MTKVIAISIVTLTLLVNYAHAEEKELNNAEKAIQIMRQAGMNSPLLEETAYFIDEHYEDDNIEIYRGDYDGLNLSLQHDVKSPDYKRLELKIAPEDANYEFTFNHDTVMFRYSTEISW